MTNYYALLPGDTDAAWNLLTKHFQRTTAGGRETYDSYWGSVESVAATDARATGPDSAEALITYQYRDGRTATERVAFDFKEHDDVLKIDDTQRLGSG